MALAVKTGLDDPTDAWLTLPDDLLFRGQLVNVAH